MDNEEKIKELEEKNTINYLLYIVIICSLHPW